jgi:hypothetical protein
MYVISSSSAADVAAAAAAADAATSAPEVGLCRITHVLRLAKKRLAKKRSKGLCCHLKVCVSAGEKELTRG